jgi:hypothetical protein
MRLLGKLGSIAAATLFMAGCSGEKPAGGDEGGLGTLALPLAAHGPSGAKYRLRDATFTIYNEYYYYYPPYPGGPGGFGGGIGGGSVITVSSEDDPDAESITVDLEQGYYYVTLQPGWRMEQVVDGEAVEVEATLLSSETQFVWVSPRSTSWVEFQFGIGERSIWLNGDLNINIRIHENPDDYYGYGGSNPGYAGAYMMGGYPSGGTSSTAGSAAGGSFGQ